MEWWECWNRPQCIYDTKKVIIGYACNVILEARKLFVRMIALICVRGIELEGKQNWKCSFSLFQSAILQVYRVHSILAWKCSVNIAQISHNIKRDILKLLILYYVIRWVTIPLRLSQRYVSHIPSVDQASSSNLRMYDAPCRLSTFSSKQRFIISWSWGEKSTLAWNSQY